MITYIVVHIRSTHHESSNVVCPLQLGGDRAVVLNLRAIVDLVLTREQWRGFDPVVRFLGPIGISLIAGVLGQPSSKLEETSIGNGIFVVVSFIECEDLPSQSTATILRVPSRNLQIEHCLCQGKP